MPDRPTAAPDRSSIGSAALRAMHVRMDPSPHVFDDELGLRLVSPDGTLEIPPGMEPQRSARLRASIVARARFIEDLVEEQAAAGVHQYVILGAGLDTFAERRPDLASRLRVFEVDQPSPQAWKRQRLVELGFGIPEWLRLVPVDFEAGATWWEALVAAGYEMSQPALVTSTGVSMYLTRDAIVATLRQCAALAHGSTLVMSFALPPELIEPEDRAVQPTATSHLISLFAPDELLHLAREAGFREARHVSSAELTRRYFLDRTDGLRPASFQGLLVAQT